jgi:uncharacterized membrane protein YvbJ
METCLACGLPFQQEDIDDEFCCSECEKAFYDFQDQANYLLYYRTRPSEARELISPEGD